MTGWLLHLTASLSRLWHFDLLQRDSTPLPVHAGSPQPATVRGLADEVCGSESRLRPDDLLRGVVAEKPRLVARGKEVPAIAAQRAQEQVRHRCGLQP